MILAKVQSIYECSKLGSNGRVLTRVFTLDLKTYDLKIWRSKSLKMVKQCSEYSLEVCQPLPNWNIRLHLRDSPKSIFSPELQISKNEEISKILNIFWTGLEVLPTVLALKGLKASQGLYEMLQYTWSLKTLFIVKILFCRIFIKFPNKVLLTLILVHSVPLPGLFTQR